MVRPAQQRAQALAQAQEQQEAIKSMTESLELVRCLLRVVNYPPFHASASTMQIYMQME